jgi:hypothetical protein
MEVRPFDLEDNETYLRWRDSKLKNYPQKIEELLVEINDPRKLKQNEFDALLKLCRKTNMALYAGRTGTDPDPGIPFSIGRRFGVCGLNKNWLADENALTSLKVHENGIRQHYIPYTSKAINWHTDGYYNTPKEQIHSMMLHSVQGAASGGANGLLDHEVAYIILRDENPEHIRALMSPDVLSIPPRMGEKGEVARRTETGPVFSITAAGKLHMRFTIRKKHVIWAENPQTSKAVSALRKILTGDSPYIFQGQLESGMGLLSNNVLHNRNSFVNDTKNVRHFYRSRYFERISGT